MKASHTPKIDARYWTAITIASIFGTNMGDLYAHNSGLGLIGGLPILIVLFLCVYVAERFDRMTHEVYYWLCIIIMRTGATNIADFMAGRRGWHIDRWLLSLGLGLFLAAIALWTHRAHHAANGPEARKTLPDTDPRYWVAMLTAGVFGTVLGDACQRLMGQGTASLVLAAVLAVALLHYNKGLLGWVYGYWLTVAVARTTGTAIGDWLAESKSLNIGLTVATVLSGLVFVAILVFWKHKRADEIAPA
jgi:uncharacterized membrane-anchored protein